MTYDYVSTVYRLHFTVSSMCVPKYNSDSSLYNSSVLYISNSSYVSRISATYLMCLCTLAVACSHQSLA